MTSVFSAIFDSTSKAFSQRAEPSAHAQHDVAHEFCQIIKDGRSSLESIEAFAKQHAPKCFEVGDGKYAPQWGAMHYAAVSSRLDVMRLLAQLGCPLESGSPSPFHLAISKGNIESAQLLLGMGYTPPKDDRVVISVMAQLLTRGSASDNHELGNGMTEEKRAKLTNFLLPLISDFSAAPPQSMTPLIGHLAAAKMPEVLDKVLREHPQLISGAERNLMAYAGDEKSLKVLHSYGFDPNEKDPVYGNTPLHNAASSNNLEVVEALLEMGANPNSLNYNIRTPLHLADCDVVAALASVSFDINAPDQDGNTPLHSAVSRANLKAFRALLEQGADPLQLNHERKTPFSMLGWGVVKEMAPLVAAQVEKQRAKAHMSQSSRLGM